MTASALRVGLDIGGTKTAAVALGPDTAIIGRVRLPTALGADAVIATAVSAVERLTAELGTAPAGIGAIGVGIPGLVDSRTGRVQHAVNLGFDDLALGPALAERLGTRVHVENDVNAAALGADHLLGLDGSTAYLNLGTGLAAGFVLEGRLWRGAHGSAGEIGHVPVDPSGALCPCGQRGCLETIASGSGIARAWPSTAAFASLDLFDRADAGEAAAEAVRARFIAGAATAIRLLALTVDVDTIVIGGGLAHLGERLLAPLRARLDADAATSSLLTALRLADRLALAPLNHPLAAVGAALASEPELPRPALSGIDA